MVPVENHEGRVIRLVGATPGGSPWQVYPKPMNIKTEQKSAISAVSVVHRGWMVHSLLFGECFGKDIIPYRHIYLKVAGMDE